MSCVFSRIISRCSVSSQLIHFAKRRPHSDIQPRTGELLAQLAQCLPSEAGRSDTKPRAKNISHVRLARKSTLCGNFGQAQRSPLQKLPGFKETSLEHLLMCRLTGC